MRRSLRYGIVIVLSVTIGASAAYLMPKPLPELSRAQFLDEVRAGNVRRVEVRDQEVIIGRTSSRGAFRTPFRRGEDSGMIDELRARGVEIMLTKSAPGLI